MEGSVKTLHRRSTRPAWPGRDKEVSARQAEQHGIDLIDLVCQSYPFEETVAKPRGAEERSRISTSGGPDAAQRRQEPQRAVTVAGRPRTTYRVLKR